MCSGSWRCLTIAPSSPEDESESEEIECRAILVLAVVECRLAGVRIGRAPALGISVIHLVAARSGLSGVLVTLFIRSVSAGFTACPWFARVADSTRVVPDSFLFMSSCDTDSTGSRAEGSVVGFPRPLSIFSSLLLSGYGKSVAGGVRIGCDNCSVGVVRGDAVESAALGTDSRWPLIAFECCFLSTGCA